MKIRPVGASSMRTVSQDEANTFRSSADALEMM